MMVFFCDSCGVAIADRMPDTWMKLTLEHHRMDRRGKGTMMKFYFCSEFCASKYMGFLKFKKIEIGERPIVWVDEEPPSAKNSPTKSEENNA